MVDIEGFWDSVVVVFVVVETLGGEDVIGGGGFGGPGLTLSHHVG